MQIVNAVNYVPKIQTSAGGADLLHKVAEPKTNCFVVLFCVCVCVCVCVCALGSRLNCFFFCAFLSGASSLRCFDRQSVLADKHFNQRNACFAKLS